MATKVPGALRRYLSELGSKGGKASAKNRTPEERSEKARQAAMARWKKAGKKGRAR
jgi:hypothetical protein